jgi:hypothetical protein
MINLEKPEKIMAELYNHHYIEGFLIAVKQHKSEQAIEAEVKKITPLGIFELLSECGLESKIAMNEKITEKIASEKIEEGSLLNVKITHLTSDRIVIEWLDL